MSKTVIHVNKHRLRAGNAQCVAVRRGRSGRASYTSCVVLRDANGTELARIAWHDRPLKCGARVWVEVAENVKVSEESIQ